MWKKDIFRMVLSPFDKRVVISDNPIWVAQAKFNDEFANKKTRLIISDANYKVRIENIHIWNEKIPRFNSTDFLSFERRQVMFHTMLTGNMPRPDDIMLAYVEYKEMQEIQPYSEGIRDINFFDDKVIVHLPILRLEEKK